VGRPAAAGRPTPTAPKGGQSTEAVSRPSATLRGPGPTAAPRAPTCTSVSRCCAEASKGWPAVSADDQYRKGAVRPTHCQSMPSCTSLNVVGRPRMMSGMSDRLSRAEPGAKQHGQKSALSRSRRSLSCRAQVDPPSTTSRTTAPIVRKPLAFSLGTAWTIGGAPIE
jgi:hypothetical protein